MAVGNDVAPPIAVWYGPYGMAFGPNRHVIWRWYQNLKLDIFLKNEKIK
jgi:hypothetical protein